MSRKPRSQDPNQLAASIVAEAVKVSTLRKDPAAVSLGRKGGLKGGHARAAKLSEHRLSEIARKAALARWHKNKG